jgi:hypothetical protein
MKGKFLKMGNRQSNMTLGDLRLILTNIANEETADSEVWLSCDEEGNEFLPMSANEELSIGIDRNPTRIILFPSHR